jgi:type IX secretion system substrate protein
MVKTHIIFWLILVTHLIFAQQSATATFNDSIAKVSANDTIIYLDVPERAINAIAGSDFVAQVTGLSLEDRERAIVKEILNGNMPSFSRKLKAVTIQQVINDKNYELNFFTVLDYMAIGSDQDYLYIPMTPSTAQYLAGILDCTLPTKTMVDKIYNNAEIKLSPQPIPPSDKMTTVPVFKQHTDSIKLQISHLGFSRSADNLIAGHKKDIIISNKIYSPDRNYERVVIYGWHLSKNNPIQPVYNGHSAIYADYSHGVHLISNTAFLNGDSAQIKDILKDPDLSILLSNEGVISKPFYPASKLFTSIKSQSIKRPNSFRLNQNFPNPFNPTTVIQYQLPSISQVDLSIFSVAGKKVVTLVSGKQAAGNYKVEWNAFSLSSGIYIYTLKAGLYKKSRKMILLQ